MNETKAERPDARRCVVPYRKIDAIEDIIQDGFQNKVTSDSSYDTKFNDALEACVRSG